MRQFVATTMPDTEGKISICGKDFKYLTHVLRLTVNQSIEVRLPNGNLAFMTCEKVNKSEVVLKTALYNKNIAHSGVLSTDLQNVSLNMPEIWLYLCVCKPQKMDEIIRQATEIGVAKIIPVLSDYAQKNASFGLERLERWKRIIKEARQQSGSPIQTQITEAVLIDSIDFVNFMEQKNEYAFIFTEKPIETKSLYEYLTYKPKKIAAVIGPEGGFSEKDCGIFYSAGFLPLHFNINILRTETAAIYALSVLTHSIMEFDSWNAKK